MQRDQVPVLDSLPDFKKYDVAALKTGKTAT